MPLKTILNGKRNQETSGSITIIQYKVHTGQAISQHTQTSKEQPHYLVILLSQHN